ncbi:phosphatase PAP2 family protein [Muricoccus pecuniae]|uniref:Phosphatidic acid phosphatase type 2/haloperoxidase domain-containing protein n=1 Tax=Muricoccus pecuniae TaxID=693023 RepID=A0A840YBM2_9PROT|nr:phosphatase PAP2 family protein [Roseomonas pecuniae]MBB5696109.1 hypothetical protein [Roseomonas pecuniae]
MFMLAEFSCFSVPSVPVQHWSQALDPSNIADQPPKTDAGINAELAELRALTEYRAAALEEALAQRWGIITYLRGVVTFSAASHRNTFLLIFSAQMIGSMVAMHYKRLFARARPSRLDPALLPPIEVPGHASYPSAHATEAMLIALILEQVLPPEVVQDLAGKPAADVGPLRMMARRTARNREVLGVHYPSDTLCGYKLAARLLPLFLSCPTVAGKSTTDGKDGTPFAVHEPVGIDAAHNEPCNLQGLSFFADGLLAKARQEW